MLKDKRKVAFPSTKPQVTYDKCEYFPFNLPGTYICLYIYLLGSYPKGYLCLVFNTYTSLV